MKTVIGVIVMVHILLTFYDLSSVIIPICLGLSGGITVILFTIYSDIKNKNKLIEKYIKYIDNNLDFYSNMKKENNKTLEFVKELYPDSEKYRKDSCITKDSIYNCIIGNMKCIKELLNHLKL